MESTSIPAMSHPANVDITFGSFCSSEDRTGSDAPVPSSKEVSVGEKSQELRQIPVAKEETEGLPLSSAAASAMSSFDLPTSQEIMMAITEWPATSSNPQQNIWASSLYSGGNASPLNVFGMNYAPGNSCCGSLGGQPGFNSFHPCNPSSIYGNSSLNYASGLRNLGTNVSYLSPVMFDSNHGFLNDEALWDHNANNCVNWALASPPVYAQQLQSLPPEFSFFQMAKSPEGSENLKKILEQGKYTREIMRDVFPFIIELMTHHCGHRIFEILLEKCENSDLYEILKKISSQSEAFLGAAFCETGSRSIQRLIKKLKNTGLESALTLLLSKSACQLMTHKIASHVVRQCFILLGDEPNKVLHDCIFAMFLALAMDPMGCITINDCIDNITGSRRAELLNLVAKYASQLSYDPSGNFVVQHVLSIHNESAIQKICVALKGQYVLLSQKKGGSHVVEKCLQLNVGRPLVMDEIFKNEKTLLMLARDKFGNYVIQTALKLAMIHDKDMYTRLLKVLQPRHPKIVQKVNGHHVNNKMKGDAPDVQ